LDIKHVNWTANKVAHTLSKMAVNQLLDFTWMEECPLCIQYLVFAEQASTI